MPLQAIHLLSPFRSEEAWLIFTPGGGMAEPRIYSAAGPQESEGGGGTMLAMGRDFLSARELAWRLFRRDFKARYQQSLLGIAWAVVLPMATVGLFLAMKRSSVINIGRLEVPYPLYALVGLSI